MLRKQSSHALHTVKPNNTRSSCLTEASGTELAGAYYFNIYQSFKILITEIYDYATFIFHLT